MPLPSHLSHQARGTSPHGRGREALGDLLRGVVLKVVLPDSPDAQNRAATNKRPYVKDTCVKCDVLVFEMDKRFVLYDVPILTESGGINDHEVWTPRATTQTLTGEPLVIFPEGSGQKPTPTHDMDGDFVLVGFVDRDLAKPVIVDQIPHPRTRRIPSYTDSPRYKWKRYIRGIAVGITDNGDVRIDTTAASDGKITLNGQEIPKPGSGKIEIVLPPGNLTTGIKVSILDGGTSNPEPSMLGDTYLTDQSALFTKLVAALADIAAGLATIPYSPTQIAPAITELNSVIAKITTSQTLGRPYLSSHLETD